VCGIFSSAHCIKVIAMNAEVPTVKRDEISGSWAAPRSSRWVSSALYLAYLAAAIPLIASAVGRDWPYELASHFVVQGAIVCVVLIACGVAARRRRLVIGNTLLAAVYGVVIAPLEISRQPRTSEALHLRMVSANLQFDHHDPMPMLAWLQQTDPDLLVLVELTPAWAQALKPVLDRYANRIELPHSDAFGIGVYSKRPLQTQPLRHRPPVIAARIGAGAGVFTLFAVHTMPPVSPRAAQLRDTELSAIAAAAKAAGPRVVVAGDLNATSWSPVFRHALGGDTFIDSRAGLGVQASWPASWPAFMRIPIDHVLIGRGGGISVLRRELGPDVGSDHRPVLTDLGLSE